MGNTYSPRLFAPALTRMPDKEITSSINSGTAFTPTLSSISIGGARKVKAVSLGSLLKYLGTMGLASYSMNGDYYVESTRSGNSIRLYPGVGSNLLTNYCPSGLVDGDRIRFKARDDVRSSGGDSALGVMVSPPDGDRYLEYYTTSKNSLSTPINIRDCIRSNHNAEIILKGGSTSVDSGMWTSPPVKGVLSGDIIGFEYGSGYSSDNGLWNGNIDIKISGGLSGSYSITGIYFQKIGGIYPSSIELTINNNVKLNIQLDDDYTIDPSHLDLDHNKGMDGYVHGSVDLSTQAIIKNSDNISIKVLTSYYKYGSNSNSMTYDNVKLPLVDESGVTYYRFNLSGIIIELAETTTSIVNYSSSDVDYDDGTESETIKAIDTNALDPYNYGKLTSLTPINGRVTSILNRTDETSGVGARLGAFTTYFGSLGNSSESGELIFLIPTSNFVWSIYPYSSSSEDHGSFVVGKIVFNAQVDDSSSGFNKSHWVFPYQIRLTNNNHRSTEISYSELDEVNGTATFNLESLLSSEDFICTTDYDGTGSNGVNVLKLEILKFIDKTGINTDDDSLGARNFINYRSVDFYEKGTSTRIPVTILELSPKVLSQELTGGTLSLFNNVMFSRLSPSDRNHGVIRDNNNTRKLFLLKSKDAFTSLTSYSDVNSLFYCVDNIPCVAANIGSDYYIGKAYTIESFPSSGYVQGGQLSPISGTNPSTNIGRMYDLSDPNNKMYSSLEDYLGGGSPVRLGRVMVVDNGSDKLYAILDCNPSPGQYTYVYELISGPDISTNGYNGITRSKIKYLGNYYYYDQYEYIYYIEWSGISISKILLMTGNDNDTIKYENTYEYALPFNPKSFNLGSSPNPKSIYLPSVYSYTVTNSSTYRTINYDELLTISPTYDGRFINSIVINSPLNSIKVSDLELRSIFNTTPVELYYQLGSGGYIKSLSNSVMVSGSDNNVFIKLNINVESEFKPYNRSLSSINYVNIIYPNFYYFDGYRLNLPNNTNGAPLSYGSDYSGSLVKLLNIDSSNYRAHLIVTNTNKEFYNPRTNTWTSSELSSNYIITTENSKYYKDKYSFPRVITYDDDLLSGPSSSLKLITDSSGSSKVKKINLTRYPNSSYPNKVTIGGKSSLSWSADKPIGSASTLIFNFNLPSSDVNFDSFYIMHDSTVAQLELNSESGSTKTYTGSLSGRALSATKTGDNISISIGSGTSLSNGSLSCNIIYKGTVISGSNINSYGCHRSLTATHAKEGIYELYVYDVGSFSDTDSVALVINLSGSSTLLVNIPAGTILKNITISGKTVRWTYRSTASMGTMYLTVLDESGEGLTELNSISAYYTPSNLVISKYINSTNSLVMNTSSSSTIDIYVSKYPEITSSEVHKTLTTSSTTLSVGNLRFTAEKSGSLLTGKVTVTTTSGYVYGDITITSGSSSKSYDINFDLDNVLTHVVTFNPELTISNTNGIELTFSDFRNPDGSLYRLDGLRINYGYLSNVSLVSDSENGSSKYIEVYQGDPNLGYDTIPLIDSNNSVYKTSTNTNLMRAKLYRSIRYLGYDENEDYVNKTLANIVDGDIIRNNIYTIVYRNSYYDKNGSLHRLDEPYFELIDNSFNLRPTVDLTHLLNTYDYILPKVYQSGVVKVLTVTTSAGSDSARVNRIFPWKDATSNDGINEEIDIAFTSSNYKEGFATIMLMSYVHGNETGWSIIGGVNTWNKVARLNTYSDCNNISGDRVLIMY